MPVINTNYEDALNSAIENKDSKEFLNVISKHAEQAVLDAVNAFIEDKDGEILRARGIRQLTSAETSYYKDLISAMRENNFKAAVSNIEKTLPTTIIEDVFTDIEKNHPLLKHLDIQFTAANVKLIYATTSNVKATWGALTAAISQQVAGSFVEESSQMMKVSAYVPIPLSMLDLGPVYIDQFVRTLLYESIANALEDGCMNNLVSNTGPIGMIANMSNGTVSQGVTTYTAKTAITLSEFSPEGMAAVLAAMAVDRSGDTRDPLADGLFLVVNPLDMYSLVKPALCVQNALGQWVENKPYDFDICTSRYVTRGTGVMGIDKKYFLHAAMDVSGKIEWTDDFDFLNDNRTYKIKLYANGTPKDNNAFQKVDISGLTAAAVPVKVKGTVKTKEQA